MSGAGGVGTAVVSGSGDKRLSGRVVCRQFHCNGINEPAVTARAVTSWWADLHVAAAARLWPALLGGSVLDMASARDRSAEKIVADDLA